MIALTAQSLAVPAQSATARAAMLKNLRTSKPWRSIDVAAAIIEMR